MNFNILKDHTTADNLWLLIHGTVYDLTNFISKHPGGGKILLKNAGTDATAAFSVYHSKDNLDLLEKICNLGQIDPKTVPESLLDSSKSKELKKLPLLSAVLNLRF